ncbi:TPA: glycosyltransferase family 2 protein [Mannheimia haemolytica]
MPKISVIIPFYKTPHLLLRKAIDKLLVQSFNDFEILLIDDGNGEEYDFLKQEYVKKDSRVRFIYQENAGVSQARNTGILASKGEYIIFHDADDFVENNYLYSLYKELDKADFVICGIAAQWYPTNDTYVDIRQFLSSPSQYNYVQYLNFSVNKIFRKDILEYNNILFHTDIKLGEDALFISDYLRHCKLIRVIPQRLYYYIPYNNSATNRYDEKYWDYEKKVIESQFELFSTYPLNEDESKSLYNWLYIKLRGSLFYYLWWEKDDKKKEKRLVEIFSSKYFNMLLSHKDVNSYSKTDRLVIFLWKKLGLNGVKLTYYMKIIKGYLK